MCSVFPFNQFLKRCQKKKKVPETLFTSILLKENSVLLKEKERIWNTIKIYHLFTIKCQWGN